MNVEIKGKPKEVKRGMQRIEWIVVLKNQCEKPGSWNQRQGAVRYLDFGNLPIPEEAKEFHREKVSERELAEHRKMNYEVFIEDIWALSQG